MKRKIIITALCGILAVAIAGCGDAQTTEGGSQENYAEVSSEQASDSQVEIESYEVINGATDDSFTVKYKIKNISDETIPFLGISIKELDDAGDILNNYYSYDEDTVKTDLESEQSVYLELSFPKDEGITTIESNEYALYVDDNDTTLLPLSDVFVVEVGTKAFESTANGLDSDTANSSEPSTNAESSLLTLSEYIGSGEEVLAYDIKSTEKLTKDTEVYTLYVFKGDQVDLYYGFENMTLTDVASMTDEETIEYCKNNVEKIFTYPYQVLGLTDDTGNNISSEVIRLLADDHTIYLGGYLNGFNKIYDYEVYDSVFTGFCYEAPKNPDQPHNWLAFENAPTLTFDTKNTGNIIIDPYSL